MLSISETLVTPMNIPIPYGKIFLRSIDAEGDVLPSGAADAIADENGLISFDIVRGTFRVFFQQENTTVMYPVGYILESVFDNPPSPVTLVGILTKQLPEEV